MASFLHPIASKLTILKYLFKQIFGSGSTSEIISSSPALAPQHCAKVTGANLLQYSTAVEWTVHCTVCVPTLFMYNTLPAVFPNFKLWYDEDFLLISPLHLGYPGGASYPPVYKLIIWPYPAPRTLLKMKNENEK